MRVFVRQSVLVAVQLILRWNGTRIKAGLGGNNLFDRNYYFRGVDYSQGCMPQPGRAVLLSLQADL